MTPKLILVPSNGVPHHLVRFVASEIAGRVAGPHCVAVAAEQKGYAMVYRPTLTPANLSDGTSAHIAEIDIEMVPMEKLADVPIVTMDILLVEAVNARLKG